MNQMLLVDCVGYTTLNIVESVGNGRTIKFEGKMQEANAVNKNKRLYPMEVLKSNTDKLEEAVKNRGLFGELDHPSDSIVHLANASHLITKLWWEGNVLNGQGETLDTPSGNILKRLIESGARVGISSRGVGNGAVNSEGVLVIGEGYKLICFDMVADPSVATAFQSKIVAQKEHLTIPQPTITESKKISKNTLISLLEVMMTDKITKLKGK